MGKLIKIKDTLTPDLRKRARAAANKRPLLQAMGTAIQSLGQQAFTDAAKRPAAWAPRKDPKNTLPLLMGDPPVLERSLRTKVEASRVVLWSDLERPPHP
jgi:phage gpG-like protein